MRRDKHVVKLETAQGTVYLQTSLPNNAVKLTKAKSEAHWFDSRDEAQHFVDNLPTDIQQFSCVEPAP